MPPTRPGGTVVELPRALVVGLSATLALALLAVAFLLGRLTARAPVPEPAPAATLAPPETLHAPATGKAPLTSPTEASGQAAPGPESLPEEWRALGVAPAGPPPGRAVDEREAVVAYFEQVDRLEASFQKWNDPQQLALQLLQQATQGDSHGVDELLAAVRQSRQALQAVVPPPACREHHAESLALVDAALDLLGRVRPALSAQDFGGLQALAGLGHDLETRTKRLQALEDGLRQRYGLSSPRR